MIDQILKVFSIISGLNPVWRVDSDQAPDMVRGDHGVHHTADQDQVHPDHKHCHIPATLPSDISSTKEGSKSDLNIQDTRLLLIKQQSWN